jgi:hypothetical protein
MTRAVTALCSVLIFLLCSECGDTGASLGGPFGPGQAPCPTITIPKRTVGARAIQASSYNIAIELSGLYMRDRVTELLQTRVPLIASRKQLGMPEGHPAFIPRGGIKVNSVTLEELPGPPRANFIVVTFTPWIRYEQANPADPSGDTMRLGEFIFSGRVFRLRLELIPYLVVPPMFSDSERRSLLKCRVDDLTCTGVALDFEFVELYDLSAGERVRCEGTSAAQRNASYDVITAQVLQGVWDALYGKTLPGARFGPRALKGLELVPLPVADIIKFATVVNRPIPSLVGVAVGSDRDLKIGLLLDTGTPATSLGLNLSSFTSYPFNSQTAMRGDWGLLVHPWFLHSVISASVIDSASQNNPPVEISPGGVNVQFDQNGINVTAAGVAWPRPPIYCFFTVSFAVWITPAVCRDSTGTVMMRMCASPPRNEVPWQGLACAASDAAASWYSNNVNVGIIGDLPDAQTQNQNCQLTPLQFDPGSSGTAASRDVLYGTGLSTANQFYIFGQSTLRDRALAAAGSPRASAPPLPCP